MILPDIWQSWKQREKFQRYLEEFQPIILPNIWQSLKTKRIKVKNT